MAVTQCMYVLYIYHTYIYLHISALHKLRIICIIPDASVSVYSFKRISKRRPETQFVNCLNMTLLLDKYFINVGDISPMKNAPYCSSFILRGMASYNT